MATLILENRILVIKVVEQKRAVLCYASTSTRLDAPIKMIRMIPALVVRANHNKHVEPMVDDVCPPVSIGTGFNVHQMMQGRNMANYLTTPR